jgi:type I restriction enzyme S subunit
MVLRPNPQHILPDFLPFFLQSDVFMNRAEKISVGSLSPTINWSSLREEEFSLPPMEEQQRLVSILNAITDTINAASDGLDRGEQARDSIIVGLYSRGTEDGATQDTEIGILPKSWRLEPLGTRFHIQLGKMMSESARSADGKIPYIRNANVQWNRLDLNDVATMSFTPDERKKFSLRHGDILACEGRHVGKAAMWRGEIPGACYQKALHRLRAIRDDVPSYLLHCLYYYSRTGRFGAVTGETTIPHLPAERLRAMLFPFPDREEQLEIAEIVDAFDKSIKQLRTRRASAVTMLRAVLAMEAT